MKPEWNDAPDWANWLAQDSDGKWCWYEEKPRVRVGSCYFSPRLESRFAIVASSKWRESLEARP